MFQVCLLRSLSGAYNMLNSTEEQLLCVVMINDILRVEFWREGERHSEGTRVLFEYLKMAQADHKSYIPISKANKKLIKMILVTIVFCFLYLEK